MGENLKNKRLYKVELLLLKVLPMLIALCYALNSLLSYFDIDLVFIGYVAHVSLLPLIFLYTSSYMFRFCEYHRMFLHYTVINELINIYDYYIGIPITNRDFFILHIVLIWITLFVVLYLYVKHHKKPVREDS